MPLIIQNLEICPSIANMSFPLQVQKTTYAIVDILEWQRTGSLDLQPYYQRRSVWNPRVKSLLIDSLLRGYPIPLVFLHNRLDVVTSKTVRQVVDGQQRLRTILSYIDIDSLQNIDEWDSFSVLKSHNEDFAGLTFQQLPEEVQTRILHTSLSINVLPSDIDDVTILSIFQRMNSTGFKLNDQEIRNATYFGEFKECSYKLAYSQNQMWERWGIFDRQEVAQMREVELTSDLMGLLISRKILGKSKASLNKFYTTYENDFPERELIEQEFLEIFKKLESVFPYDTQRVNLKRFRTTPWFYTVFAAASGIFGSVSPKKLLDGLERVELKIRNEPLDEKQLRALRGGTANRDSRVSRLDFLMSQIG